MSFRVSGLSFSYPRSAQLVLNQVNASIPPNQTTAIMGVSGVGKSTLLYLLGLLWQGKLAAGEIFYQRNGKDESLYKGLSSREQAKRRRQEFGFVFQNSLLLPNLTCAENIELPLVLQGMAAADRTRRVRDLLERAAPSGELVRLMNRHGGQISQGQQARIAALRALAHDPRIVFADEPFSNLDDCNRILLADLLADWRKGILHPNGATDRSLILVSHDYRAAHKLADYFLLLYRKHKNHLCRSFSKNSLKNEEELLQYLWEEEDR